MGADRRLLPVMALLLAAAAPLQAQRATGVERWDARRPAAVSAVAGPPPFAAETLQAERSTGRLLLGGLLGGLVGAALGGAAGAGLWGGIDAGACSYEEWVCRVHGFYWGATVGESLGIPLGVHLANDRRGDLLTSTLVSAALGAAGSLAIVAAGFDPPVTPILLVAVPVAQLTAATILERRTAR